MVFLESGGFSLGVLHGASRENIFHFLSKNIPFFKCKILQFLSPEIPMRINPQGWNTTCPRIEAK